MPYDEWKDNDTLEKMANDLNDGGTNLVLGNLDHLITVSYTHLTLPTNREV